MGKLVLFKTEKDFESFRASKSFQTNLLKIRVHWSQNQNIPRFGFIVPKKVLSKVVDRNKLKRRIKSFLSKNLNKFKPVDVLIFPRASLLKITYWDLEKEFKELFLKAHLWK